MELLILPNYYTGASYGKLKPTIKSYLIVILIEFNIKISGVNILAVNLIELGFLISCKFDYFIQEHDMENWNLQSNHI